MRYFSFTLLSLTLATALAMVSDAHTVRQDRIHPLKTLAEGPHPDSIKARSLTLEKRQYVCSDPGYSVVCGTDCCQTSCSSTGSGCGCDAGTFECSNGGCCPVGWTCQVDSDQCETITSGNGGGGGSMSSGPALSASSSMSLIAAVAAVIIVA